MQPCNSALQQRVAATGRNNAVQLSVATVQQRVALQPRSNVVHARTHARTRDRTTARTARSLGARTEGAGAGAWQRCGGVGIHARDETCGVARSGPTSAQCNGVGNGTGRRAGGTTRRWCCTWTTRSARSSRASGALPGPDGEAARRGVPTVPGASGVLTVPTAPRGTHSTRSARGTHSTRSPIECLRCTRRNANATRIPLAIDSHLRESRARPIPLASLRRQRAMWETTLFVVLADNGGPICTLTALFAR